jgi:hypothetical protein
MYCIGEIMLTKKRRMQYSKHLFGPLTDEDVTAG